MKALIQFAHRRPVLFLFVVSVVIRLLAAVVLDLKTSQLEVNFMSAGSGEQFFMANSLHNRGDLTYWVVDGRAVPSAYQPVLLPWLLSLLFAAIPNFKAAFIVSQVLQSFLGGLTVMVVFWLARRLLVDKYALLAGILAAFYPPLIYMPNEANPIAMLVPVLLWIVILCIDIQRDPTRFSNFAWMGVACILGVLMRSEFPLAMLIIFVFLLFKVGRRIVPGLALAAFCMFATLGIWVVRNHAALGKYVLTTTTGVNLFRGNGPTATGGSYQWDGDIVWNTDVTKAKMKELHWSADYELHLDGIYSEELKKSLAADPLRPIKLLPYKALFFWTSDFTHPKGSRPIAWLGWMLLLPATVYGLIKMWKYRCQTWPFYVWFAFYFCIVLVFFALPRYRLNVEAMFLIVAAAGIGLFREKKLGGSVWSPELASPEQTPSSA